MNVVINGVSITANSGCSIVVEDNKVFIDGVHAHTCGGTNLKIEIVGGVANVEAKTGNITVNGPVSGNVRAATGVTCGDVDGDATAGTSLRCGHVLGNVVAGTVVTCMKVAGSVKAGTAIRYITEEK